MGNGKMSALNSLKNLVFSKTITVREASFRIRELTLAQRQLISQAKDEDPTKVQNLIVAYGLINDDGSLALNADDIDQLGDVPQPVLQELAQAILDLGKGSADAEGGVEKKD